MVGNEITISHEFDAPVAAEGCEHALPQLAEQSFGRFLALLPRPLMAFNITDDAVAGNDGVCVAAALEYILHELVELPLRIDDTIKLLIMGRADLQPAGNENLECGQPCAVCALGDIVGPVQYLALRLEAKEHFLVFA